MMMRKCMRAEIACPNVRPAISSSGVLVPRLSSRVRLTSVRVFSPCCACIMGE